MEEERVEYPAPPYRTFWDKVQFVAIATDVRFDNERMYVRLADEREISVPIKWSPLLSRATPEQRANWKLELGGRALRWEAIDEDVSVRGLLGPYD